MLVDDDAAAALTFLKAVMSPVNFDREVIGGDEVGEPGADGTRTARAQILWPYP
jgi:hypothetical protein